MSVVKLEAITKPQAAVDGKCVELCEHILEMAKAGEIHGIAYATVQSAGAGSYISIGSGFGGGGVETNIHVALGALAVLTKRLVEFEAE